MHARAPRRPRTHKSRQNEANMARKWEPKMGPRDSQNTPRTHFGCIIYIKEPDAAQRRKHTQVGARNSQVGARNSQVGARNSEVGARNAQVGSKMTVVKSPKNTLTQPRGSPNGSHGATMGTKREPKSQKATFTYPLGTKMDPHGLILASSWPILPPSWR